MALSRKDKVNSWTSEFVAAKYNTGKPTGRELLKRYGGGSVHLYLVFDAGRTAGPHHGRRRCRGSFMDNLRTIIARQKPLKKQP